MSLMAFDGLFGYGKQSRKENHWAENFEIGYGNDNDLVSSIYTFLFPLLSSCLLAAHQS